MNPLGAISNMWDPFNATNFFVPLLGSWDTSVKKIMKNL